MGYNRLDSDDWTNYAKQKKITSTSNVSQLFKNNRIVKNLDPQGVTRESCDSEKNPKSTAVIIGLDVTGSMGYLSEEIAKGGLVKTIMEIYDKKPISDPHILVAAIGDAYSDSAPLQVTQYEADIKVQEQLQQIYFEGYGGGNDGESYLTLWYFAARHTKIDCYEKRGQKGFLFTIGDEPNHGKLTKKQIHEIFGDTVETDFTAEQLLTEVSRMYDVFHICVGDYERYDSHSKWKKNLGERAFALKDHTKIPETIVSTLEVLAGKTVEEATASWDGSTAVVVKNAINGLQAANNKNGIVTF